jgi:RNA polymerase primary sigma factor
MVATTTKCTPKRKPRKSDVNRELIGVWDACGAGHRSMPTSERNRCCATARPNRHALERASLIKQVEISYIHHPDFDQPSFLGELRSPVRRQTSAKAPASPPRGLPPYVADLYRTPLLEREEEAALFRRMNGLKYLASQLQACIDVFFPEEEDMQQFERWLGEAEQVRNMIVEANLRLVFSLAKRFAGADSDEFNECVAEGNIALMRAVDLFDYSRGNRFSTYAHHAIRRQLFQRIQAESRRRERFVPGAEEAAAELDRDEGRAIRDNERVHVAKLAVLDLMPCLTDRERAVIEVRFGLGDQQKPQTYEEIGRRMGVSKERVRQLQMRALQKMARTAADSSAVVAWEEAV